MHVYIMKARTTCTYMYVYKYIYIYDSNSIHLMYTCTSYHVRSHGDRTSLFLNVQGSTFITTTVTTSTCMPLSTSMDRSVTTFTLSIGTRWGLNTLHHYDIVTMIPPSAVLSTLHWPVQWDMEGFLKASSEKAVRFWRKTSESDQNKD